MGRLDPALLKKMAKKLGRAEQSVRESISHKAARQHLVSEAVQVTWAQELGISPGAAFRKLAPHHQQQVQERLRAQAPRSAGSPRAVPRRAGRRASDRVREAVNLLLTDQELKDRCADLLRGRKKLDRPVNQATLVLEDRLRKLGMITTKATALELTSMVLHPKRAVLRVHKDDDVQEGVYSLCKGLFAVFRNLTHHHLTDKFSREDAMSICGFIDAMLRILGEGKLVSAPPREAPAKPEQAPRKDAPKDKE